MRGLKGLLCSTALLAPLALAPMANAQIAINIGGPPPVCSYGYYNYAPYACAPVGYYGSGYFYNGIFLGMGPWAGWGYNHGWGGHRFVSAGGGRYTGGFTGAHARSSAPAVVRTSGSRSATRKVSAGSSHAVAAHGSRPASAPHAAAGHGEGSHGGGGESHGGGGDHR
jgi:hypothetical protein